MFHSIKLMYVPILCTAFLLHAAPADTSQKSATCKTATPPVAAKKMLPTKTVDTLVVTGRIIEIPGKFPSNDLYNYVYIMKYRVLSVVNGAYAEKEILVGVYNPAIPRNQIKDKMARYAKGNADAFTLGLTHTLTLIKPIDAVWKDAIEDEYFDATSDKYYALRVDVGIAGTTNK